MFIIVRFKYSVERRKRILLAKGAFQNRDNMTPSFVEIPRLYSLPFNTGFSIVVGQIAEVMPASPATGGSRQQIRIHAPGSVLIDVQIFDHAETIPMSSVGSVVRFSASPNAVRALVWERSKASKPTANIGVIVVRKQARLEIFRPEQAAMVGATAFGAAVATPSQGAAPVVAPPLRHDQSPAPAPQESRAGETTSLEIARRFGECLEAARRALGPQADPDDVRVTAKVIYEEKFSRRAVA